LGQIALRELGIESTVVFGTAECLVGPDTCRDRVKRAPRHAWLHTVRGEIVDFSLPVWRENGDPATQWQITPQLHWDSAEALLSVADIGQARYVETEPRQWPAPTALVEVSIQERVQIRNGLCAAFPQEVMIADHERLFSFAGPGKHLSEAERILSVQMVEIEHQQHKSRDTAERTWMGQELCRLSDRRIEIRSGPRLPKLRIVP
jgi:hypothetical protein